MASGFLKNIVLALALATAGTFVVPMQDAMATTLYPLTVEQRTDISDYIVRGTVTEVWTEMDERGSVWTRARVSISDIYKGPDAPADLIIDSFGGTYGAHTTGMEARAVFSVHEELIAFLSLQGNGRLVPIGKFMGKYSVRKAPDSDRSHVMLWHPTAKLEFDARFLPHPAPEDRTYLDDLLTQVNDHVATGWDGKPIPGASMDKLQKVNTPAYRTRR